MDRGKGMGGTRYAAFYPASYGGLVGIGGIFFFFFFETEHDTTLPVELK